VRLEKDNITPLRLLERIGMRVRNQKIRVRYFPVSASSPPACRGGILLFGPGKQIYDRLYKLAIELTPPFFMQGFPVAALLVKS
jgi:hypothetical protein